MICQMSADKTCEQEAEQRNEHRKQKYRGSKYPGFDTAFSHGAVLALTCVHSVQQSSTKTVLLR